VPIHEEVLRAARRLCRERGEWVFSAEEVVRALAHLNEHSVRTHVSSRCCVNAPPNHPHRWPYFRRVARGRYEILPPYREERMPQRRLAHSRRAAEPAVLYGRADAAGLRDTIHAVLQRDGGFYVAECLEVAVVTQGTTADEVLTNLQEAIALHLEGEDPRSLGLIDHPRLVVTYEVPMPRHVVQA